jgi:predicted MFS family arabinose efflux permease
VLIVCTELIEESVRPQVLFIMQLGNTAGSVLGAKLGGVSMEAIGLYGPWLIAALVLVGPSLQQLLKKRRRDKPDPAA